MPLPMIMTELLKGKHRPVALFRVGESCVIGGASQSRHVSLYKILHMI